MITFQNFKLYFVYIAYPDHCTACNYNDDNSALICTTCETGYGILNDQCEGIIIIYRLKNVLEISLHNNGVPDYLKYRSILLH